MVIEQRSTESHVHFERAVSAVQRLTCQIYHAAARLYLGEVPMPNDERQRRISALITHANRYYQLTSKLPEVHTPNSVSEACRQSIYQAARDAEHHANTSVFGIVNTFST